MKNWIARKTLERPFAQKVGRKQTTSVGVYMKTVMPLFQAMRVVFALTRHRTVSAGKRIAARMKN